MPSEPYKDAELEAAQGKTEATAERLLATIDARDARIRDLTAQSEANLSRWQRTLDRADALAVALQEARGALWRATQAASHLQLP